MKPRIKLMADYYCYPLWGMDQDNIGDIDPKTLPLNESLINQLEAWSKIYDLTLNREDPNSSGFLSEADKQAFEDKGIELWRKLCQELSDNYEVYYFSILQQSVIKNTNNLSQMVSVKLF
jgi:hypothetical protein